MRVQSPLLVYSVVLSTSNLWQVVRVYRVGSLCTDTVLLWSISTFIIRLCRLVEWVFQNVHPEDVTDEARAVYLRGLHEALSTEGGKSPHAALMPVSCGWRHTRTHTYTHKCTHTHTHTHTQCHTQSPSLHILTPTLHKLAPTRTQYVIDNLQSVLDVAETSILLEAVVKNIIIVAKHSPQHLGRHFQVQCVCTVLSWCDDLYVL